MTGYTGQLSGGSWSAIFPQAIAMNEIIIKENLSQLCSLYKQMLFTADNTK